MRLALISLDQHWHDRVTNIVRCQKLVEEAANSGCELVVFPEMTLTGYSFDVDIVAEHEVTSDSMQRFGQLSKQCGIDIVFGACLICPDTQKPRNTLCQANPDGVVSVVYAKIHPFSFVGEDKVFEAGRTLGYVTLSELKLGASVCYDLRFPELYAAMAPHCAGAICIANWPAKRESDWRALLVARAIENQMFMFGVNRMGVDGNGLEYEKSSMSVTPSGKILAPIYRSPEIDIFEFNPQETLQYRTEFPTLRDKRPSIYENL